MTKLPDADSFAAARVVNNNDRRSIIKSLGEEPRNISKLVEATGIDRSPLCYHLSQLENHGFVDSRYRIPTDPSEGAKGIAPREHYLIDEKLAEVRQTLDDIAAYLRQSMEKVLI